MAQNEHPWLNHYDAEVPPIIDYEERPLFEFLDKSAEKWPKRIALKFKNYSLTYAKLKKLTEVFAANLRAQGVRPGDKVAVMLPNSPMAVITYWGILRAGGVVVMTNPLYMETEIIHQFNDSGAKFLIMLDLLWPRISKLQKEIPIEKFCVTSIADGLKFPLGKLYKLKTRKDRPTVPFDGKLVIPFTDMLKGKETFTCKGIDPRKDTALLQYTGGTTGVAKGCVITHFNMAANMQQCKALLHDVGKDQEKFVAVLPFFHIYGLTVCLNLPTAIGATVLPMPRFVPKDLLKLIHGEKPTIFPGAPSVYLALIQQKKLEKYNLKSIRYCISGSAPMPVESMKRFMDVTGALVVEGYGLTEASPVTHFNPLKGTHKLGSIGLPVPDTEAKIVDMEVGGEELPPGKEGELLVRAPQVMVEYYNRAGDTADVLRNGWLYTGDIAYMDEDGYFYIVDRRKDMVISGGYNIYPREIDEVLYAHPKISEAVAVGIPHRTRGEIVKAYVIPVEGEELTKQDIMIWCREKLANYKVPRQVEFRDELPKTLVGKVLRRALREEEEAKTKPECPSESDVKPKEDPESGDPDRADNPVDAG